MDRHFAFKKFQRLKLWIKDHLILSVFTVIITFLITNNRSFTLTFVPKLKIGLFSNHVGDSKALAKIKRLLFGIIYEKIIIVERLRVTFTPNGRREFALTWPNFPLYFLFIASTQKFMPVLPIGIVRDCFYLLIFYSEKFSTWVWRLPFAVNVNLNLSSS